MTNGDFTCTEHSGCVARIDGIERQTVEQWDKMAKIDDKMNVMFTRINFILGGIAISCVLLAINLAIKAIGPG